MRSLIRVDLPSFLQVLVLHRDDVVGAIARNRDVPQHTFETACKIETMLYPADKALLQQLCDSYNWKLYKFGLLKSTLESIEAKRDTGVHPASATPRHQAQPVSGATSPGDASSASPASLASPAPAVHASTTWDNTLVSPSATEYLPFRDSTEAMARSGAAAHGAWRRRHSRKHSRGSGSSGSSSHRRKPALPATAPTQHGTRRHRGRRRPRVAPNPDKPRDPMAVTLWQRFPRGNTAPGYAAPASDLDGEAVDAKASANAQPAPESHVRGSVTGFEEDQSPSNDEGDNESFGAASGSVAASTTSQATSGADAGVGRARTAHVRRRRLRPFPPARLLQQSNHSGGTGAVRSSVEFPKSTAEAFLAGEHEHHVLGAEGAAATRGGASDSDSSAAERAATPKMRSVPRGSQHQKQQQQHQQHASARQRSQRASRSKRQARRPTVSTQPHAGSREQHDALLESFDKFAEK